MDGVGDWRIILIRRISDIHSHTDRDEGFSREWAATSEQRSARRQMEVQVNDRGNPQYRTVTAPAEGEVPPNYENPEEREWNLDDIIDFFGLP